MSPQIDIKLTYSDSNELQQLCRLHPHGEVVITVLVTSDSNSSQISRDLAAQHPVVCSQCGARRNNDIPLLNKAVFELNF